MTSRDSGAPRDAYGGAAAPPYRTVMGEIKKPRIAPGLVELKANLFAATEREDRQATQTNQRHRGGLGN